MDELITSILTIIEQMEVKSTEQFIEAVLYKLSSFGYGVSSNDEWLIAFCIQKVINHIMNSCNTTELPDGLFYIAVDRVCGEFLYSLKNTGKLELDDIDISGAIREINEGDITIKFDVATSDDEKFIKFIEYLKTEGRGDEVCYRKLKW